MFDGMSKNGQNHFRLAIEMEISFAQIVIEEIEFVLVSDLPRIEVSFVGVFSEIFSQYFMFSFVSTRKQFSES